MDYFQGVVSEYLRADRSVFINTEFLLQLDDVALPAKDRHWYCDAVAVSFKESTVYLCEISYSTTLHALIRRLQAWAGHWPAVCEGVLRDTGIAGSWKVQPWAFIPHARRAVLEKRLSALKACATGTPMPQPRVTDLESVLPWKYRSWNGKAYEAEAAA